MKPSSTRTRPGHTALQAGLAAALALGATSAMLSPQSATAQTAASSQRAASASPATDWVEAEVRRIDLASRKITLKHGEIKQLDMPGMTMAFALAEDAAAPELLAALKPGDKLSVQIVSKAGRLTVIALRR